MLSEMFSLTVREMQEDLQHGDEVSSKACPMTMEIQQGDVLRKDEALSKAGPTTPEMK